MSMISINGGKVSDLALPDLSAKAMERVLLVSEVLNPVHVDVINESYFYSVRRRIGGKKHMKLMIRENKTNMRLESYIYKLKRSEDDGSMVAKKTFLSSHSSKWAAYKHAEASCKLRDSNPNLGNEKLFTHFIVRVVSHAFDKLPNLQRNALVYEELLRSLGSNCISLSHNPVPIDLRPPEKIKLGSIMGDNMCNLPIFRFVRGSSSESVTFLIEARTPSQWKPSCFEPPLSERFGSDHIGLRSGFLPSIVSAQVQRKAIKLIASSTVTKLEPIGKKNAMLSQVEADSAEGETDGAEPDASERQDDEDDDLEPGDGNEALATQRSTVSHKSESNGSSSGKSDRLNSVSEKSSVVKRKKKEGGVYGHFFNDVSPDIRALMMEGYRKNKRLIQREGTKKPPRVATEEDDHTPQTTLSAMKKKMEGAELRSAYDSGTKSEDEMIELYNISNLLIEKAVIRLQRIWRIRCYHKAIRYTWRRQYAAITIQRVLRGSFGRTYYSLLAKLIPIATCRIQRQYRKHLARKAMAAWLKLVMKAVRIVGPIVRKFATKCIEMWYLKINTAVIKIQALMRRYLGHFKFCRVRGHMYNTCIGIPAVVTIQRYTRGRMGRKRAVEQLERVLFVKVDVPCANIIQRVFRGTRGRIRARHLRFINRNCGVIQRYMRAYHNRMKTYRRYQLQLEKWAATNIQRMYRGVIDRERAQRRKYKHWYGSIFIPAVVKAQSAMRRVLALNRFLHIRQRHRASTFIKVWYRTMLKRAELRRKWRMLHELHISNMAAEIQKIVRAHQARRLFHRMRIADASRKIIAGKIILRAWVNFRDARRFKKLFDEHLEKLQSKIVKKMADARRQVIADKIEALTDLEHSRKVVQKTKTRLDEVDLFLTEASMRVKKIQAELDLLTGEDIDRGWAEAFGTELESLTSQMTMAREEKRLRIVQLKNAQNEYIAISVEHEELDIELDAINIREIENMERLRLGEIVAIERRLNEQKARRTRIEKCKWKIQSNRRNIIQRIRDEKLREQARLGRSAEFAMSIAFEKKQQRYDYEELALEKLREDRKKQLHKDYRYEDYAKPVVAAYDSIIDGSLNILRHVTLDERGSRIRQAHIEKEKMDRKNARHGRGLTFALKPENQVNLEMFE